MSTPLTDAINALTATANATTGASDTTLSDAVASLIAGYGGGGYSIDDLAGGEPSGAVTLNANAIVANAFNTSNLTSVKGLNVLTIAQNAFVSSKSLTTAVFPSGQLTGSGSFNSCNALECLVIGDFNAKSSICRQSTNANNLVVDIVSGNIGNEAFRGSSALGTLILRSSAIQGVSSNSLTSTKFDSGGAGGTIYIPESLYNHLGDGSSNDYKSASNWSTLDGYGTITWAKIEGSIYENAYADGTAISS